MIQGQEMELELGMPVSIYGFSDGIPRVCYPFYLEDVKELNMYLENIDCNNLFNNFSNETNYAAITWLFQKSFHVNDKRELKALFSNITEENFGDIMSDIKMVSGISGMNVGSNNEEGLDWSTAISAITVHTSHLPETIKKLTLYQFNNLLEYINKEIAFEYKTNTIALSLEPSEYINDEDFPLSPKKKEVKKKYATLKDIQDMNLF